MSILLNNLDYLSLIICLIYEAFDFFICFVLFFFLFKENLQLRFIEKYLLKVKISRIIKLFLESYEKDTKIRLLKLSLGVHISRHFLEIAP